MKDMAQIRVLLVEDDDDDAMFARRTLGKCDGMLFEIRRAKTFAEAIRLLRKHPFHLMLLDLNLPDSNAQSTVKALAIEAYMIPTIVLTGNADENTSIQCIEIGADDVIDKNKMTVSGLCAAIRKTFARWKRKDAMYDTIRIRMKELLKEL